MRRTPADSLAFVQSLLYSASAELKAVTYSTSLPEDICEQARHAEASIDAVVIALKDLRGSVKTKRPRGILGWILS
jgi:hypothetical protein